MYKHEFFESRAELLKWLNSNQIQPEQILSILPMPTTGNGYQREYELFYRQSSPPTNHTNRKEENHD